MNYQLTTNERRIIKYLSISGPASKRDIEADLTISWATTVKMIKRLESAQFISCLGRPRRKGVQGVDSAVYDVNPHTHHAIGIDVGYEQTTLVIVNIKNQILFHKVIDTKHFDYFPELLQFLLDLLAQVLDEVPNPKAIEGIGIGIPAFILLAEQHLIVRLQEHLEQALQLKVLVERGIRGYTLYRRYLQDEPKDFVVLSIRKGIGLGIIMNQQIYQGSTNMAGEISHTPIPTLSEPCVCGQIGCLETGVSLPILNKDFELLYPKETGIDTEESGASRLIAKAKEGDRKSLQVLTKRAEYFAYGLVPILLILNIPEVFVASEFGTHGQFFVDLVSKTLANLVSQRIEYSMHYLSLSEVDFALGASHLILKEFC